MHLGRNVVVTRAGVDRRCVSTCAAAATRTRRAASCHRVARGAASGSRPQQTRRPLLPWRPGLPTPPLPPSPHRASLRRRFPRPGRPNKERPRGGYPPLACFLVAPFLWPQRRIPTRTRRAPLAIAHSRQPVGAAAARRNPPIAPHPADVGYLVEPDSCCGLTKDAPLCGALS